MLSESKLHFCVVNFSLQFNASHVLPTVLHAGVPLAPSSTSMAHPSPGVCVFMLDLPKAMIFPPASYTFFSFHRTTTLSLPSVLVPSMVWCWVNIKFMQNLIIWCIQCLFFFRSRARPLFGARKNTCILLGLARKTVEKMLHECISCRLCWMYFYSLWDTWKKVTSGKKKRENAGSCNSWWRKGKSS